MNERTTIEGSVYEVALLPAGKARKVFTRIARLIGPTLSKLEGLDISSEKDLGNVDIMPLLGDVLTRINDDDLDFVCTVFAEQTLVGDGDRMLPLKSQFDIHFQGKFGEMMSWLGFCLKLNFSSFFSGFQRVGAALKAPKA